MYLLTQFSKFWYYKIWHKNGEKKDNAMHDRCYILQIMHIVQIIK